ncbi:MAG: hypothetical protein ABI867_29775 [Kofleriaceae bacterium]
MRLALATALAICLAASSSWGHSFPPVRTVVVQVERCEVVLLVGYRPGSGEASESLLTRAATQPKSQGLEALRAMMTQQAMAPLSISVDGVALVPTKVRAKIGTEPGGARPMVVVLVSYALPAGKALQVTSKDTRTTRISWTDRESSRVMISNAPAQGHWFSGVASFLLPLTSSPCATSQSSLPPSVR